MYLYAHAYISNCMCEKIKLYEWGKYLFHIALLRGSEYICSWNEHRPQRPWGMSALHTTQFNHKHNDFIDLWLIIPAI